MFSLIFYYWQSLNSHILDYTKAESLWRHFKGFFRLIFFFFKWGVCKWWVLDSLGGEPNGSLKSEAWRGWGEKRSKHMQNAEKNWLKDFALSFPSFLSCFSFPVCDCGPNETYLFQRITGSGMSCHLVDCLIQTPTHCYNSSLDSRALFLLQQLSQQQLSLSIKSVRRRLEVLESDSSGSKLWLCH